MIPYLAGRPPVSENLVPLNHDKCLNPSKDVGCSYWQKGMVDGRGTIRLRATNLRTVPYQATRV